MSRGVYRGIHSSLLDDPDFQRLSAPARHVLLTVRLCKEAGPAVIFRYYPEVIARQAGYSVRRIHQALGELEREQWILRDQTVLWVRNGLRHDPTIRLGSSTHMHAVVRQIEALPKSSASIILKFCDYYKISGAIDRLFREKSRCPPSPNTESEVLPEVLPESRAPKTSKSLSRVIAFRIAASITEALDRSGRLGAVPRLRSPEFWKAQIHANGSVDLPQEIAKADAWLVSNPSRAPRKDLPRFLHTWFTRAREAQ